MHLQLITPPSELPVSVAELKAHLRITHSNEDGNLERYLHVAIDFCERAIDGTRAFGNQTWQLFLRCWPTQQRRIRLPKPPLQSIDAITYLDENSDEQTLDSDLWIVHAPSEQQGWLEFPRETEFPEIAQRDDAICIQYQCGYQLPNITSGFDDGFSSQLSMPATLRAAILLVAGSLFEQRETHSKEVSHEVAIAAGRLLALNAWGHYS